MAYFIALHGKKESGKSLFCSVLEQYISKNLHGCEVHRASFAEALRNVICEIYQLDRGFVFGNNKDKLVPVYWEDLAAHIRCIPGEDKRSGQLTLRELFQFFGTNLMRKCWCKDVWSNIPFAKYHSYKDFIFLIDDARFANELSACRREGGINIWITRQSQKGHNDDDHASEKVAPAELIDFHIDGIDGVAAFTEQALEFIEKHKKGLFPDVYLND